MIKTYLRSELNALNVKMEKLNSVSGEKIPYAAHKNHEQVKRELKIIQHEVDKVRSQKAPKEDEYHAKWMELYKAAAKKDEKGNPIVVGQGKSAHYDLEDVKAFNESVQALDVEYKEVTDDVAERNKKLQNFLSKPVQLEFHEVDDKFLERGQGYTATKEQLDIVDELFVKHPVIDNPEVKTGMVIANEAGQSMEV